MLSKRRFLLPLAALIAVVLSFSFIPGAESYVLSREISSGSFGSLALPNDVAIGPNGNVFIADGSNFTVLVLDAYGELVTSFSPPGSFLPQYVSVSPDGQLYYVTNLSNNISRVALSSGAFLQWGSTGAGNGQFSSPTGIATAPDGTVYVTDTNNNRVQKFSSDGVFISAWGSAGTGNGQFMSPQAIAVDSSNSLVLVLDTDNNRIQGFDTNGNFLGAAGSMGSGPVQFFAPAGIAFGPDPNVLNLFISDIGNARVQKFSSDGSFDEFGENLLSSPHGISVDNGGNVYVADTFNNRIAVFTPEIIRFENGAENKIVQIPGPVDVMLDLSPDSYWNNAPAELYAWIEGYGLKAYYQGPNTFMFFDSFEEMPALASGFGVPAINNIDAQLWTSSAGLPQFAFEFFVCLDRVLDGIYKPTDSVCDSIHVMVQ